MNSPSENTFPPHVTQDPDQYSIPFEQQQLIPMPGLQEDDTQTQKSTSTRKRMSYANKCIRANKYFFLIDKIDDNFQDISNELFINGRILSVPRKDVSSYYKLLWDVSQVSIDEDKLRLTVHKDDIEAVSKLKQARLAYDEKFSNSAHAPSNEILSTVRKRARRNTMTSSTRSTTSLVEGGSIPQSNRSITNLRMSPVFATTSPIRINNMSRATDDRESSSESESEDEELHGSQSSDDVLIENATNELNADDLLYGYLPDETYDPTSMEEDGAYPEELHFTYENVPPEGIQDHLYHYQGKGPCLRHNVSNKFQTCLEACGVAGGFTYQLIKRITANSNAYVDKIKVGNRFFGTIWTPITVQEMYRALGIILKMSIDCRQLGGIQSYFSPPREILSGPGESTEIDGFSGWAADIMSYFRFRQIRAALRPELDHSSVGDKCHQLRASLVSLNEHAKRTFILGREASFDEGGIPNKSRYNPVRQYNASKPDKYRIDFFVLVNASKGKNFIFHLDVYQGKNATNAHITQEAWHLPTTQKAVVNAVISSGINNDPDGMRELYMDNRYTAPELFVLLREKYQVLACGTIRSNRKGWDSNIMNLKKSSPRGTSLVKYDPTNKILFGQWNDNKVVSFISTLGISGSVTVKRRVGKDFVEFQVEEALKRYTRDNYMGGVDNMDKDKKLGGSFTKFAHFKKWYKMGLLGVFDFMIVNGRIAWNMSAEDDHCRVRRFVKSNWEFRLILAQQMIRFQDDNGSDLIREVELANEAIAMPSTSHTPKQVPPGSRVNCCVCSLEEGIQKPFRKSYEGKEMLKTVMNVSSIEEIQSAVWKRSCVAYCSDESCTLYAHYIDVSSTSSSFIFQQPEFKGLTCFQIAHHNMSNGLWACNTDHRLVINANEDEDLPKKKRPRAWRLQTSHALFSKIRQLYGLNTISRQKSASD